MARYLVLLFSLALMVGCSTPTMQIRVTVEGGEKLVAEMPRGIIIGEDRTKVMVNVTTLVTSPQKKMGRFVFVATILGSSPVKSVLVEEVSGKKADVLVDDKNPKIDAKSRLWHVDSKDYDYEAPALSWLHEIDDTFLVYRFTVTYADGTVVKVHQVGYYMAFLKTRIRKEFGQSE